MANNDKSDEGFEDSMHKHWKKTMKSSLARIDENIRFVEKSSLRMDDKLRKSLSKPEFKEYIPISKPKDKKPSEFSTHDRFLNELSLHELTKLAHSQDTVNPLERRAEIVSRALAVVNDSAFIESEAREIKDLAMYFGAHNAAAMRYSGVAALNVAGRVALGSSMGVMPVYNTIRTGEVSAAYNNNVGGAASRMASETMDRTIKNLLSNKENPRGKK